MKMQPDPVVRAWFRQQEKPSLFVTAITVAEVWLGIELLPDGRRRQLLEQVASTVFGQDFSGRNLDFDSRAAVHYGKLAAELRKTGQNIGMADIQIAAIARVHGFMIATRNIRDFAHCGIELIDPFTPSAAQ